MRRGGEMGEKAESLFRVLKDSVPVSSTNSGCVQYFCASRQE